jgi:hypothetical protein
VTRQLDDKENHGEERDRDEREFDGTCAALP